MQKIMLVAYLVYWDIIYIIINAIKNKMNVTLMLIMLDVLLANMDIIYLKMNALKKKMNAMNI